MSVRATRLMPRITFTPAGAATPVPVGPYASATFGYDIEDGGDVFDCTRPPGVWYLFTVERPAPSVVGLREGTRGVLAVWHPDERPGHKLPIRIARWLDAVVVVNRFDKASNAPAVIAFRAEPAVTA